MQQTEVGYNYFTVDKQQNIFLEGGNATSIHLSDRNINITWNYVTIIGDFSIEKALLSKQTL